MEFLYIIYFFILQKAERDECFAIELGECDGGAELGKIKKTIITIVNDDGKWLNIY